jgi:uncharacterized protein (TIGR03067 family)
MRTTTRLALIVATAVGLANGRASADEPKGDLAKLQGTWSAKVGPNKDFPLTLIIKEDAAEIVVAWPYGDEFKLKGKVKLNDRASPKTLDWVGFTSPQGDEVPPNLGIYKLEGDSWTTCSGGPGNDRPSKFEAGEGAPPTMTTWTRLKEKAKDKPDEKPIAGDLARFQGAWTGKAGANEDVAINLTIKGNAVTARWDRGDGTELVLKGEMRVNDQASPRTVDFFNFKRSDGEETKDNLGIYAFDGDQVKICTGGPGNERPTELKAGDGGHPSLFVLTRKKD